MKFSTLSVIAVAATMLLLSGCVTYLTPGAGAPMSSFAAPRAATDSPAEQQLQLPARIIVVRVQAPGYRSFGTEGVGDGDFSVILDHEVETGDDFNSMREWPQVLGVESMSRLLLPASLHSFDDLRAAAAAAQTDVLFAYTFDTSFHIGNQAYKPEQLITLGVLPGREASVFSTAAGVFVDVRKGVVLGASEGSAVERTLMTKWTKPSSADETRLKAEHDAFEAMMDDAHHSWERIVSEYSPLTGIADGVDQPPAQRASPAIDAHGGAGAGPQ